MSDDSVRDKRLQAILKKWMDAAPLSFFKTIPKQDLIDSGIPRDDLEKHGLISSEASHETNIPQQCGKREFARVLTALFGNGKEIFPMQVDRAIEEGMHGYNKRKRSIVTSQAIQWWRDNKAKTDSQLAAAAEAEAKRKIVALQIAEMDLEERKREMDERWIMKDDAATTVTAAVLAHHAIVKKQFDKKFSGIVAKHLQGEWTEEQINRINIATIEAGRDMMQAIEEDCASEQASS